MSVAVIEGAGFGDWDGAAAEWRLLSELGDPSLGYEQAALVEHDPFAGERLVAPETPYLDLGSIIMPQVTDESIRRFFDQF